MLTVAQLAVVAFVEQRDLALLRDLLDAGHDIEDENGDGLTLLRHAIAVEHDDHRQTAEPPTPTSPRFSSPAEQTLTAPAPNGTTPLDDAEAHGHWIAVELLRAWTAQRFAPRPSTNLRWQHRYVAHDTMIGMSPFEQVVASFWHPEIEHLRQPPLTDELIADAENELGVTLPLELLHLLRIQNGGVIADTWDACPVDANFYADDHVPFEHLYGIGPAGQAQTITLLDTPYLVQEWELPSPVVLLSGQGHYWLALDYRDCGPEGNPPVVWIDNEMNHELLLAPDFRAFVERLTATPE